MISWLSVSGVWMALLVLLVAPGMSWPRALAIVLLTLAAFPKFFQNLGATRPESPDHNE